MKNECMYQASMVQSNKACTYMQLHKLVENMNLHNLFHCSQLQMLGSMMSLQTVGSYLPRVSCLQIAQNFQNACTST